MAEVKEFPPLKFDELQSLGVSQLHDTEHCTTMKGRWRCLPMSMSDLLLTAVALVFFAISARTSQGQTSHAGSHHGHHGDADACSLNELPDVFLRWLEERGVPDVRSTDFLSSVWSSTWPVLPFTYFATSETFVSGLQNPPNSPYRCFSHDLRECLFSKALRHS